MQAELILLIAPAVPCYKLNIFFTMLVTLAMLLNGWYSANLEGDLWTTDFKDVFIDFNLDNLTEKGTFIFPSFGAILFLSFVQIPYLALCYNCADQSKMPEGFNKMLLLTSISWLGFPIWWFLSYEGASVITDTKLNGFGFMMLNVISKGGFTLCMISMVKNFKRKNLAKPQPPAGMRPRSGSIASVESLPQLPGDGPDPEEQRRQERLPTGQSLVWMIKGLREFDGDGENEFDTRDQSERNAIEPTRGSELKNEDLIVELMRRLGVSMGDGVFEMPMNGSGLGKVNDAPDFERTLNAEIANACLKFVDEESDDGR
jgi:hypothetical protein